MAALSRGAFRITPDPCSDAGLWDSTTLDLRLDGEITYWEPPGGGLKRDIPPPDDPEFDYDYLRMNFARTVAIPADGFPLARHGFCLGWTMEKLDFPHQSRIAARVEGKSSLARMGVGIHVTAPTIHAGFGHKANTPGWEGRPLQLEIWNVGPWTMMLKKGMKICQLVFEEVHGTPTKGYSGRFADQGPQLTTTPPDRPG